MEMNESNEPDNFNDGRNLPLIEDYSQKSVIVFNQNNSNDNSSSNTINNNNSHSNEYKMDIKLNNGRSNSNKNTEEDPLTGQSHHQNDAKKKKLKWRREFASTNFFMVIFLLAYVLQGCYFTYFVSVITTIEKLFKVKSSSIAFLLNFSEAGQILTSLLLTYYAGRGHRPRWIACGMFLFSLAALGSVSPHFIYGDRLYNQNAISTTDSVTSLEKGGFSELNNASTTKRPDLDGLNLCISEDTFRNQTILSTCNSDSKDKKADNVNNNVLYILAVSLLGIGIGQTAIATLGIPYIDDNVQSKQSPLYMAITIGVRILGPAIGYYLGSLCMSISYDLTMDKDNTDPGFIGAWYLGLLLVATSMCFASLVMFTFPKTLRNKTTKVQPLETKSTVATVAVDEEPSIVVNDSRPKFKDFAKTIKRQVRNDILMFRTASAVLHLLPITGLYVFLPKYLENQFHMQPTTSSLLSGTFGILVMGVGIFITGVISVKFPLSARKVSLWIAFTALATAFGLFVLSTLGCPMDNYPGLKETSSGSIANSLAFTKTCNTTCECNEDIFAPICGADDNNYFSPCHAGCSSVEWDKDNKKVFTSCKCISEEINIKGASEGFCPSDRCKTVLIIFVTVFALTVFIHSTSEVGGMLIIMRCTHPKDKAMAMGIVQFSIGLLSNIPCPHIFSRIVDATCIVWNKVCNNNTHCQFYNSDTFRRLFFGTSCFIMLLAFVMDIVVFFKSHRIDIDPENNDCDAETNKEIPNEDQGAEDLLKLRKMSNELA